MPCNGDEANIDEQHTELNVQHRAPQHAQLQAQQLAQLQPILGSGTTADVQAIRLFTATVQQLPAYVHLFHRDTTVTCFMSVSHCGGCLLGCFSWCSLAHVGAVV